MKLWRLSNKKYADSAFGGEGSFLYGGRWSPPGCRVVYLSQSVALCALETLVHVNASLLASMSTVQHVIFPINIEDNIKIETTALDELPSDWADTPSPDSFQEFGSAWYERGEFALLQVPSAITLTEHNYLFNPHHADASRITVGDPVPFNFDPRLYK